MSAVTGAPNIEREAIFVHEASELGWVLTVATLSAGVAEVRGFDRSARSFDGSRWAKPALAGRRLGVRDAEESANAFGIGRQAHHGARRGIGGIRRFRPHDIPEGDAYRDQC